MYLSKSDFKVARTCGTKLYYRKLRFPTALDDDPYLEFLADGGYMVEAIARLSFPEGREIIADSAESGFAATMEALKEENVTLFEATLLHGQLLAQVDILEKRGSNFRVIEVKAKSVDSENSGDNVFGGKKKKVVQKWMPYLEDVAYQTHILHKLFPLANVKPWLCVVDKSKKSTAETTFDKFEIVPRSKSPDADMFRKPGVRFMGDVAALMSDPFVRVFEVTQEVDELLPEVERNAAHFATTLTDDKPIRIAPTLGAICKKCEYRIDPMERSGFRECWGELADPSPHVLDLYQVSRLGAEAIARMVEGRKTSLTDISPAWFQGKVGERQSIQLEWTLKNAEFIDPELPRLLASRKYPLQFLDFEASRLAVPYHSGMHPYEQVAFQWSCHTIPMPGAALVHREWININEAYPNFEFARSLKEVITGDGTVFVWSPFENATLTEVQKQLVQYGEEDPSLAEWLGHMVTKSSSPIVDLHRLALEYYFHPDMKGSTSIKDVLPAIWCHNVALREHAWFAQYAREEDGRILKPYETLEPLPFGDDADEGEAVRQGTAAIRTYQEMMYGMRRWDSSFRQTMKQLLLNYCKLDTAAMVMIWMHWTGGGTTSLIN